MTETPMDRPHPMRPLTGAEIEAACAAYAAAHGDDATLFCSVALAEPSREDLASWRAGADAPARRAEVVAVVDGATLGRAQVELDGGDSVVVRHELLHEERPALLLTEVVNACGALVEDPRWIEALARRGVTDLDAVQMDPWPPGTFGHEFEAGRRLTKVVPYLRHFPGDNGYAHPIENVAGYVDCHTGEVVHVEDGDRVPIPDACSNYDADHIGIPLRTDLQPLEITQPDGVSFTVDDHTIHWQRWRLTVSMQPIEGLVLHDIAYRDGGRWRPILHRAAIAEMVVPYGSTSPSQNWKNAFDVGEWGLGRMVNSLELGCDCLGEIHYLDWETADERGNAMRQANVICVHEEDYGILWKHQDLHTFTTEVRRSRRLVVSAIHTVGNYEYGFYWHFYLDGTVELLAKLTGVVQPEAFVPGSEPSHANVIGEGLAAPHHQHLFCARLDMTVDGRHNSVYEVDAVAAAPGPANPQGNGIESRVTLLATEGAAQRLTDAARSRTWRITNPDVRNGLGQPVAYKLLPGPTPTLLAGPDSSVHGRATFATRNLWVTPDHPDERRPAGDFPSQSAGGAGLPAWTAADRSVENTDIVLWHTFGLTHLVRPEDFPVMPVEYCGFSLVPFGFFDRNPALDVPPTVADHCH